MAKVSDLDKVCSPGTEADNVEFGAAILCLEEQVPAKVPDKHGLYAVRAKASYDNSVRCCSYTEQWDSHLPRHSRRPNPSVSKNAPTGAGSSG